MMVTDVIDAYLTRQRSLGCPSSDILRQMVA